MKKYIWNELSAAEQQKILQRPKLISKNNINELVQDIINQVKLNGDQALLEFTEKFDHVALKNIKISRDELQSARQKISQKALEAINFARQKIEDYHRKQLPISSQILQDQQGIFCQRQARPIERVGLYIPGGSAPLVSTVMMLAIPANLAGCSLKVLCTPANKELKEVTDEITQQLSKLTRKNIAEQSLEHGRLILVDQVEDALTISNHYAPEHLSLQIANAEQYVSQVKNAGAIFLGSFTPETMGDYVNGSNHVLPTGGHARSISGLSVLDFMKFISIQRVSPEGLKFAGRYAETLAAIEGLTAHGRAVSIRLSDLAKASDE